MTIFPTADPPSPPRLWDRITEWGLRNIHKRRTVDGLDLFATDDVLLDRVDAALVLIKVHDPVRYRRMLGDLNRICITYLPGPTGQFISRTRTCELDRRFVLREGTTPDLIASTIVHEATHARLHRIGIGCPEALRGRIEDLCVRQQWVFAARSPNGAQAMAWAERYLNAPQPDFSDQALRARADKGLGALLEEEAGLSPKWAGRLLASIKWLARKLRDKKQSG